MKTRVQKIAEKIAKQTDTELAYMRYEGYYVLRFEKIVPEGIIYFQQRLYDETLYSYNDAELVKMIANNVLTNLNKFANEKRIDQ